MKNYIMKIMVLIVVLIGGQHVNAAAIADNIIYPVDISGIRYNEYPDGIFNSLIEPLYIKGIDCTVMEFPVKQVFENSLFDNIALASLKMMVRTPTSNLYFPDHDPLLDFYFYAGDGKVVASEFFAGGTVPDIQYRVSKDFIDHVSLDITEILESARTLNVDYLAVRVYTPLKQDGRRDSFAIYNGSNVQWLGYSSYSPHVSICPVYIPEPVAFALLLSGGWLLFLKKR